MPYVRLAEFADSSVNFRLWYWVETKSMWRVASEIRMLIDRRFKQEGIEIPFPQRVLTIKNAPPEPAQTLVSLKDATLPGPSK
jgi:small conductance mechanosensitive channel